MSSADSGKITFKIAFVVVIAGILAFNCSGTAGAQSLIPNFDFAAVGDWGCNTNTEGTVKNILDKETELVLGLGDYSYEETADCWLGIVDPINEKLRIAIGNHDDDGDSILDQFMRYFGLTKQFYSFSYQNVHFIVMSTELSSKELPFAVGSEQYEFVKEDLERSSRDPVIDWIVVYFHRPAYTSPTGNGILAELRDTYHPLFDKYGVDLVLQGHNHNYQRSYPITYNSASPSSPIITDTNNGTYKDPVGQIFVTVGTGGKSLYSFTGQAYYNHYQQSTNYGILNIGVLNNGTTLIGRFYDNSGDILDEFTINKIYP